MSRLMTPTPRHASALRGMLALLFLCLFPVQATLAQTPVLSQSNPGASSAPPLPTYASGEEEARDRLLNAHTLLIRNDGQDDGFPATPALAYPSFVAELTNWGRYQLVDTVQAADLVIEMRSATATTVYDGTTDSPSATIIKSPYFRVTVADPATLRPLWVYTVPVFFGKHKGQDLFKNSLENLLSNLKLLVNEPLSKQETIAYSTASGPEVHSKAMLWTMVGVGGAMLAAGIATPILMKNAYNDEVARQNQQQQQFCQEYHIYPCP